MHREANDFVQSVKNNHPNFFSNKKVLEVGSLDINGTVKVFFDKCDYTGLDLSEGKGVDIASAVHNRVCYGMYDVVVSTEMLEHDKHWEKSLQSMYDNLKEGGLFLFTCAGPNRPEHGTTRTDTYSSPFTTDYYRNISIEDFRSILPENKFVFSEIKYERNGEDLYFYGIKYGADVIFTPKKDARITVGIPTKNRYDSLCLTLLSIAFQSLRPYEVIIVDDSDKPIDIRTISHYAYILKLFDDFGIKWQVLFGRKLGPHHSHQMVQEISKTPFIFRIDDDEVAQPDCLEKLSKQMTDGIGAVAPLVLMPNASPLPANAENKINNICAPNIQWFKWDGIKDVDHLYSCFLYRKGIEKYEMNLSPCSHREESIFSHKIKRAGYKLLVDASAKVYHFRSESGGIRSHQNKKFYDDDENIFQGLLKFWNVKTDRKVCVLDNGLGDHYAFLNIIHKLKNKYSKITIAVCYPDVFFDEPEIELISISDAINIYGDIGEFNIYGKMDQWNWKGTLTEAFEKLYL